MVNTGSMFTFITKCTLKNKACSSTGVCLHFKVLKCFAISVQQFHTTHTPQNPLRHHLTTPKPQKSFDPPLRTKPNYSLPKLLPKNHNKINYLYTFSYPPYLTILPTQTLINPTQINKISPKTPHSHNTLASNLIPSTSKHKPQQNSIQTPNNTTYT